MSILLMDVSEESEAEMLLHPWDYPNGYVNMAHPDDYKLFDRPIPVEFILHENRGHNRLLFRISWKIGRKYMPITFLCDTGAPKHFYLSRSAAQGLVSRILTDDRGSPYTKINIPDDGESQPLISRTMLIYESPNNHSNVNIIGMQLLLFLGLTLYPDRFELRNCPPYF